MGTSVFFCLLAHTRHAYCNALVLATSLAVFVYCPSSLFPSLSGVPLSTLPKSGDLAAKVARRTKRRHKADGVRRTQVAS